MHPFITPLAKEFKKNSHAENAHWMKAYMRDQFKYYGLKTPTRRSITKAYIKQNKPAYKELETIVKELWDLPQREFQYVAIELILAFKKEWDSKIIKLIEYIITHKSWWDTVDYIAGDICGAYFLSFPEKTNTVTHKWNRSNNFWLQRTSILFQKNYKKKTDVQLLSTYILNCADSKEFFLQKVIGWALREYSKTDAGWVKQFVASNTLAPLSKREALKRIT